MPEIADVPLDKAYLLLNHGPVSLISSAHGARQNVMAAAWLMPLDFSPPKIAVVIDSRTLTRELIKASGEFAVNLPCRAISRQVLAAGSQSGRDADKLQQLGLGFRPARQIAAPLLDGCAAWLECRVISEPENQRRHDLFIAEVLAASARQDLFSHGRWHFTDADSHTLHYLAGGAFFATGEYFEADATGEKA